MTTSPVVLFVGGPRHLQTEEMHNPPVYLQMPKQIKNFIGLGNPSQEDLSFNYKVVTYTLEKYAPGPGVFIPLYVIQGMPVKEASSIVAQYFLDLFIINHTQKSNIVDPTSSYGLLQTMSSQMGVWTQSYTLPKKSIMQNMMEAMQQLNSHLTLGHPVVANLVKLFPQLETAKSNCPDCGNTGFIVGIIQHLNDTHKWPIETKIADWLETLDMKFEVKK